ncbi:MAG: SDR family oxidoreductase [Desulfobacterales bacterium]|nr:SDR family oxidoreductase [Desulfobacterales bacterium]
MAAYNVTSNSVAIATTETPMNSAVLHNPAMADAVKKMLSNYVMRRIGQPMDVAPMVLLLASDAGSWITGQTHCGQRRIFLRHVRCVIL